MEDYPFTSSAAVAALSAEQAKAHLIDALDWTIVQAATVFAGNGILATVAGDRAERTQHGGRLLGWAQQVYRSLFGMVLMYGIMFAIVVVTSFAGMVSEELFWWIRPDIFKNVFGVLRVCPESL